jgi:hypothetical protein
MTFMTTTKFRCPLVSAVAVITAVLAISSCKNFKSESSSLESVGSAQKMPVPDAVSKPFAICSDAGYNGKQHLQIDRAPDGNGASLIFSTETKVGEAASDGPQTSISGTYDSFGEVKPFEHLFTFSELKFIITMEPTKLGFYPGTLAGKNAEGKTIEFNVLCAIQ